MFQFNVGRGKVHKNMNWELWELWFRENGCGAMPILHVLLFQRLAEIPWLGLEVKLRI